MSRQKIQNTFIVCEACEKSNVTKVVMGLQVNHSYESTIYMCQICGPIDLELMQFCRESVIDCNDN